MTCKTKANLSEPVSPRLPLSERFTADDIAAQLTSSSVPDAIPRALCWMAEVFSSVKLAHPNNEGDESGGDGWALEVWERGYPIRVFHENLGVCLSLALIRYRARLRKEGASDVSA